MGKQLIVHPSHDPEPEPDEPGSHYLYPGQPICGNCGRKVSVQGRKDKNPKVTEAGSAPCVPISLPIHADTIRWHDHVLDIGDSVSAANHEDQRHAFAFDLGFFTKWNVNSYCGNLDDYVASSQEEMLLLVLRCFED